LKAATSASWSFYRVAADKDGKGKTRRQKAVEYYNKSLSLNRQDQNAQAMFKRLEEGNC
jgi:hypothetical protein